MSSSDSDMLHPMSSGGYSADVRIELRINGQRLRVAKMGPDRLFHAAPAILSASNGQVIMHVDGHERRWNVALRAQSQPTQTIEAQFAESL